MNQVLCGSAIYLFDFIFNFQETGSNDWFSISRFMQELPLGCLNRIIHSFIDSHILYIETTKFRLQLNSFTHY